MKQRKLVKDIKFKIGENQSLVILVNQSLDRVVVENDGQEAKVWATGHHRFVFAREKSHPHQADFLLSNPESKILIEDIIDDKFWGQFPWGELIKLSRNQKLNRAVKKEIQKLVDEFECQAAKRLNQLTKKYRK